MVLEKDYEDIMDRKMTNEVVLEWMKTDRQFLTTIRGKEWSFIGQELRRERGIERNIFEVEMAGRRTKDKQRLKILDWMMERLRANDGKQLSKIARDRKRWRESVPP